MITQNEFILNYMYECFSLRDQKSDRIKFMGFSVKKEFKHHVFGINIPDNNSQVNFFYLSMEEPKIIVTPDTDYKITMEDKKELQDLLINKGIWKDIIFEMKEDYKYNYYSDIDMNIPETPPNYLLLE